ncbi:OLC1v1027055C1 [Oldenlandia corymbosa var. corymbosa]|uniref:OLC1v1027055C1 n=1 Tax=Oldenlandia corymbosa var. corymbosa TaxID=529605 RepID=A0AAV1C8J1_OLDCO|nr:OLC1v1027055C1 [Oldenlandia corymbosa var. corymbosa]
MEKLKAAVPETLKRRIAESSPDDLPSTSSDLLRFFHRLPLFHQVLGDLTGLERGLCRKNERDALETKLKGNDCFSRGDFSEAVKLYTKALRFAPIAVDGVVKDVVPVLYVNRAFALYKMGLLAESVRDCSRALSIFPGYAKAWFRRGKSNASLGYHLDARRDFTVSLKLEVSSNGKRLIENEMKMVANLYKQKNYPPQRYEGCRLEICDEPLQVELQCVSKITKGRGMITVAEIPEASLIHKEDPYAAIVLKHFRETHCHFCFNELPMDPVACSSCCIPLYCSHLCQVQAGGEHLLPTARDLPIDNLPEDLNNYISNVISVQISRPQVKKFIEHVHECQGVHWPAVLPSDVVLAGRVLAKCIEQQRHSGLKFSLLGIWDLCHNYAQLPPDDKFEFHIYSIILMNCLQDSYGAELPINENTNSQLILLLSQIRVNSMAIVRVASFDLMGSFNQQPELSLAAGASTAAVKQIRVGQAVYAAGSLFNHSCQPNIHAYFISRTLYVRATEYIASGCDLELSYGAQVGQWNCKDRKQFLEDRYSFTCECRGCSKLNLSDLVLDAYRCDKTDCLGVVLDIDVAKYENQKLCFFNLDPKSHVLNTLDQVDKCDIDDIRMVASKVYGNSCSVEPGYCLNCNTKRDLEASRAAVREAEIHLRGLQDAISSNAIPNNSLLETWRYVEPLTKIFHPFNKRVAEVEDTLAQASCLVGELQSAMDHCQKSIEILEKLYGSNHIAVGNELLKLVSIQLALRDATAADSLNLATAIFARYYGSHASLVFPLLQHLKEGVCQTQ